MLRHIIKRVTRKKCYPFFYACILSSSINVFIVSPAHAQVDIQNENHDLTEVRHLIDAGALELALDRLQHLPTASEDLVLEDPQHWIQQQKLHIEIYRSLEDWPGMVRYIEQTLPSLPAPIPVDFKRTLQTQMAEALIKQGEGKGALAVLRELIWTGPVDKPVAEQDLLQWRRMVIRVYQVMGQPQDAYRAALRLQRDYASLEFTDLLQYARILLATDRAEQAMELLEDKTGKPEAEVLYLMAQLQSQDRSASKIVQSGLRQLRSEKSNPQLKAQLWAVVAKAAQQNSDRPTTANALEHVVAMQQAQGQINDIFYIHPDVLWNTYLDYAIAIGNESQYLIGMDEQWLQAAEKAETKQPVRARSLYALLILKGQQPQTRDRAVKKFILSLFKRKQGKALFRRLFLESERFPNYVTIPEPARHALADVALGESNIKLASALMATIDKPPVGTDQFNWYLRRARILIMGGKAEQGATALAEMLRIYVKLETSQLDRLMQVLFDLQTVGLHAQAFSLFNTVLGITDDSKLHREIYYWMAESLKADGHYAKASRYFLKSAMLTSPDAMDPWAQTARYQAAESLARAGLNRDARTLYKQLLKVTKDESRRAVLQREIQKLWLNDENEEEE